jgi:hypothetical protein
MSAILNIIARYVPVMSIGDAMDMASEIERESQPVTNANFVSPVIVIPIDTLVTWIHGYDLSQNYGNRGYVKEHKIATIKALREAFRINGVIPGLKEAKDAVDRYISTCGYTAF